MVRGMGGIPRSSQHSAPPTDIFGMVCGVCGAQRCLYKVRYRFVSDGCELAIQNTYSGVRVDTIVLRVLNICPVTDTGAHIRATLTSVT